MPMITCKLKLLPLVALVLLSGCPAEREQAQSNTPLKPNVSSTPAEVPATGNSTGALANVNQAAPEEAASPAKPATGDTSPAGTADPGSPDQENPIPQNIVQENSANQVPLSEAIPQYEAPIWEPSVAMSKAHEETCKVDVGDKFPALKVQSLAGDPIQTDQLLTDAFTAGKRLAVVVFWNVDNVYAREQFTRLGEEIVEPFEQTGMEVVAIHRGGTAEAIETVQPQPGDGVTSLIDPEGTALEQVATSKLPRTCLLDSQGNILWMDLEYSRGTRRDLMNAIRYHLTQQVEAAE